MNNEDSRFLWLDASRVFAVICVILCHTTETIYKMNVNNWEGLSYISKLFRTIAFTAGRLGVPLFLMISGALLLSKCINSDKDIFKFYKHNLIPLLATVEIWIIIYNLYLAFWNSKPFSFIDLFKNMIFITKVGLSHMWYMPMILGLYVVVPFIAIVIKKVSFKSLLVPLMLLIIIKFNPLLSSQLNTNYFGGVYGVYLIFGYYIRCKILERLSLLKVVLMSCICFVATVAIQFIAYEKYAYKYNVWYNLFTLLFASVLLFEVFRRTLINEKLINYKLAVYFSKVSKLSLGIYFVHKPILQILDRYFKIRLFNRAISVILLCLITFALSFLITNILMKNRHCAKWLFLVK